MIDFPAILEKLISKTDLSEETSFAIMNEILSGNVPVSQTASFLTALRAKGESADEIVGFVKAMRKAMTRINFSAPAIVDTCGTGGDGKGTFNISTAAAFVIAGAGTPVAKHGNRSISSRCGSADVLESAGVKIDMSQETAERCLKEIGITFLFAPLYHPAMKNVAPVRRELGIRTIFNILGPLVNPASANIQIVGVPKKEYVPLIASVLRKLNKGEKNLAMVVHESGYDEVVLSGQAQIARVKNNNVRFLRLTPKNFAMKKVDSVFLQGKDAKENALLLREILSRKEHPLRDVVIANASLALFCVDQINAKSVPKDAMLQAVQRARESISSGAALKKLDGLIEWSHKPSGSPNSLKR